MFQKIQPEQIQIHAFSSPSGHLEATVGSNYVYLNIASTLTGDFNITGNLNINDKNLILVDSTNVFDPNNTTVIEGTGNYSTGTGNICLNGYNNTISGERNSSIGTSSSSFSDTSEKCVILGGLLVQMDAITGTTVIKDRSSSTSLTPTRNDSLCVSFTGGHFFSDGDTFINQDLYVASGQSGVFSGNLNVLGSYYNGTELMPTRTEFDSLSGNLISTGSGLDTRIISTGSSLNSRTSTLESQTGNYILRTGSVPPTGSSDTGTAGEYRNSGDFLYIYNGSAWTRFSGVSSW